MALYAFVGVHLCTCKVLHGYFSLGKTSGPAGRQLAERFYSMWYCETSGVDVLARRSRLASKRYTVCESVNVKVCQVIINNGLFEETNQQSSLTKVFYMRFEFLVYNLE